MGEFKGLTINTSPNNPPHIYAEDDAAIFQALSIEDGVFSVGQQLRAQVINNNTVRIYDGVVTVGGHFGRVQSGSYVDVRIESGTVGQKRNDLIVCKFSTSGNNGIDTMTLEVKKGSPGSTPRDPQPRKDNIYNNGRIRELELYRVRLDGVNIVGTDKIFKECKSLYELEEFIKEKTRDTGWKYTDNFCYYRIKNGWCFVHGASYDRVNIPWNQDMLLATLPEEARPTRHIKVPGTPMDYQGYITQFEINPKGEIRGRFLKQNSSTKWWAFETAYPLG